MKKYLIERNEILYFHVEARSKKAALKLAEQAGDSDTKMEVGEIHDKIVEVNDKLTEEKQEFFILVYMFQDLIDSVDLFQDEKKAEAAFKKFTGKDYAKLNKKKWEEFGFSKCGGTNIYVCELII